MRPRASQGTLIRWAAGILAAACVVAGSFGAARLLGVAHPNSTLLILIAAAAGVSGGLAAGLLLQERAATALARRQAAELREANQALATSERYLEDFFETAPIGLQWVGPDGVILRANRAQLSLLGRTREEYLGHHVSEFQVDDTYAEVLQRLLKGESLRDFETRLRAKDGSIRHVLISTSSLFEHGRFVHIRCFTRDITALRVGEQALSQVESHLALALTAGGMGAWTQVLDSERVDWSPELEAIFGLEPGTFGGTYQAFLDLVHPDDRTRVQTAVAQGVKDRTEYEIEFRYLHKNGGERWMLGRGGPEFDASGRPVLLAGIGMDITEHKRAAEALARSEGRLRAVFNQAASGIILLGPDGGFVEANQRFCDMIGYSIDELRGHIVAEFIHPDDRAQTDARVGRLLTHEAVAVDIQKRFIRKDGRPVWVRAGVSLQRDESGKPVGILGVVDEIDDRKRAEEALRASEERYRALAEHVPALIWTTRADGTCDYVNQRWCDQTGLSLEESLDWGWKNAVHPDDLPALMLQWSHAVAAGAIHQAQFRLKRVGGSWRWHLTRATPLRDAQGHVTAWFGSCTDIHDQKVTEERLAELNSALSRSNRDLEDFAHIAAHDLREPLRGLRLCSSFIREDLGPNLHADAQRHLESIDRLGQRMDELIGSLLHYSIVGQSDLALAPVDLNALVASVVESLAPVLHQSGVRVRIPDPLPTLRCDAVRVGEVYRNLITNAAKYNTRQDRWVQIGVVAGDGDEPSTVPVLYVRDNGIGIAPEHHQSVFRIFRRLHARDEFGGGTGSGLAIVKRIVERHGGRIWIQSALDEGATFLFTLGKASHVPVELAHSHR
jgi:PAS domain S-box-containing protein